MIARTNTKSFEANPKMFRTTSKSIDINTNLFRDNVESIRSNGMLSMVLSSIDMSSTVKTLINDHFMPICASFEVFCGWKDKKRIAISIR